MDKLINSIVSQDYDDYEIIIVNDGSTDETLNIINEYSKKYDNISVVNKPNTGRGDTRNKGLEIARGKYIAFSDSDDYYSRDFFSKIIPEIKKEDFELMIYNAYVMNYGKITKNEISKKYKSGYFNETDGVKKYLQGEYCYRISNVPWNKIYVKSIIDKYNIKFDVNKVWGQDLLFNMVYVSKITKYKYIDEKLYYYQYNRNIYKTKTYIEKNIEENLKYYDLLMKICNDNGIDNYVQYIGIFFLRRFPGIVVNETNNSNYDDGKNNIESYLSNDGIANTLLKVKLKYLDMKLLICYLFLKLKLYKLFYFVFWKKKYGWFK